MYFNRAARAFPVHLKDNVCIVPGVTFKTSQWLGDKARMSQQLLCAEGVGSVDGHINI